MQIFLQKALQFRLYVKGLFANAAFCVKMKIYKK